MLHQTGSGVLGPVFRAFDSPRDRLVAIKVFRLDILPEQVVRLADALRRLQSAPPVHPLIVPLLDVGLEGTVPFVVMSFQPGETLDIVLRRAVPMPVERAIAILRPLAATLAVARETGVLHGALHPRDVFVPDDHDGLAGVTGFGIVQALETAGLNSPLLRRPYVAPERAGGPWDARADVFSLGAIAHELLTGRRPAPSGEQDGVFAKEMPPERRVQLRKVLTTALADQPELRFSSSEALINALDDVRRRSPAPAVSVAAAPGPVPTTESAEVHEASEPQDVIGAVFPSESEEGESESESESESLKVEDQPAIVAAADARQSDESVVPAPAIVPVVAQAESWIDTALASPSYDVPAGVFTAAPAVKRRQQPVLFKTLAYAAAGLLVGAVGALWVANRWLDAPEQESQAIPNVVAKADVAPAPAVTPEPVPVEPAPAASQLDPPGAPRVNPPAATDVRPAAAPGRLIVRSQPAGALVMIDGRRFGETPVDKGLALGTYAVLVAHPGHVPRTERVTLRSASPVRTLDVKLAPGLDASAGTSIASTRGAINIDSRPRGARVIVDGQFMGHSPFRFPDVEPGDHKVTLEMGGYRSATSQVHVVAGRTTQHTMTLRSTD